MEIEQRMSGERAELLADVAEMYFFQNKTQAQIAKRIGVTRSMVSRMLTEARRQEIVEISVHRPVSFDLALGEQMEQRFGLHQAFVLNASFGQQNLLKNIGEAGAYVIKENLKPNMILGLPWGTTVSAVVDALKIEEPIPCKIVQLVGALGSRNLRYDGHGIVQRLAQLLGGEAYYINAPFIVDSAQTANALLNNQSVRETLNLASRCHLALLGIGSTEPEFSSYYQAGYLSKPELDALRGQGAVGGVCGLHFNAKGESRGTDFQSRLITIDEKNLKRIPVRIGVAGGLGKVEAILGALNSGLINLLVTDNPTAREVLVLANQI